MRRFLAFLLLLLTVSIVIGAYYGFLYLPEQRRRRRIQPLADTFVAEGYTSQAAWEKALVFDRMHEDWAINNWYNHSVIRYAVILDKCPILSLIEKGGIGLDGWILVDFLDNLRNSFSNTLFKVIFIHSDYLSEIS